MKFLTMLFALASSAAFAQHHDPMHSNAHDNGRSHQSSAYAGMQSRTIKALSAQQIEDLRSGKGMALALPAELNGFPGPLHVLELASELKLTQEQKTTIERLYADMKQETISFGEKLIAAEARLDMLFREKKATGRLIEEASADAARIQGALRVAHLRYHIHVAHLLRPTQIAAYGRLRGY